MRQVQCSHCEVTPLKVTSIWALELLTRLAADSKNIVIFRRCMGKCHIILREAIGNTQHALGNNCAKLLNSNCETIPLHNVRKCDSYMCDVGRIGFIAAKCLVAPAQLKQLLCKLFSVDCLGYHNRFARAIGNRCALFTVIPQVKTHLDSMFPCSFVHCECFCTVNTVRLSVRCGSLLLPNRNSVIKLHSGISSI